MELEVARKIAQYAVPRMLFELPQDMKIRLVRPEENQDSLLFRLVEKVAADIMYKASELEKQERERNL
ncbi:MAG: hypothetical protein WAP23_00510 [Candidatus Spechtbacterales bacterium]